MLQQFSLALGTLALNSPLQAALKSRGKRMGIVVFSYAHRRRNSAEQTQYPAFEDALELLDHIHSYDAGGLQTSAAGWDRAFARKVRKRCEELGLFFEGQVKLPADEADIERFENEIRLSKEAGAKVVRIAIGNRRYEDFDTAEGFEAMKDEAWKSLRWAEPIARRHRIQIAIENHKDWRIPDMLQLVVGMSSEYVGVCIDTGNSISLLEHPNETVEAFAKYAFTTHIKDMAVAPYEEGFLLSEVPVGQGFLDMKRIFDICEKANPDIQFNLEMITRNPLKVPCLTDKYWATFDEVRGHRLAKALAMVKENANHQLTSIEGKEGDALYRYEEANVLDSVEYSERHLGLKS